MNVVQRLEGIAFCQYPPSLLDLFFFLDSDDEFDTQFLLNFWISGGFSISFCQGDVIWHVEVHSTSSWLTSILIQPCF